jgi:hypothetical protein
MRSRGTTYDLPNGARTRVISIGVPDDHIFADHDTEVGSHGLRNLRIGPIRLPAPPVFVVRLRRGTSTGPVNEAEEFREVRRIAGIQPHQRVVHIDPQENSGVTDQE